MRMRRAVIAVLVVAAGCKADLLPGQPSPGTHEGAWAVERERFTRSAKLYDGLDDVAFATATYLAPSVREARAVRVAEWQGVPAAERDARVAAEARAGAESEEFLLAFFTSDRRANDLATGRGTWRISLAIPVEGGVVEATPAKVEHVRLDPTIPMLYPYVTDFDQLYLVRFPRYAGAAPLAELPFTLRIAGALGRIELRWEPGAGR
jgi:hypothetical protein